MGDRGLKLAHRDVGGIDIFTHRLKQAGEIEGRAIGGRGVGTRKIIPQPLMEQQVAVDEHGDAVRIRAIRGVAVMFPRLVLLRRRLCLRLPCGRRCRIRHMSRLLRAHLLYYEPPSDRQHGDDDDCRNHCDPAPAGCQQFRIGCMQGIFSDTHGHTLLLRYSLLFKNIEKRGEPRC